jgi:polysaccharide pyruvyl transferase WcaK-like protein
LKALVFGGWFGSGNIGDDAILIGFRDIVKTVMPDMELTAISMDPSHTRKICGVDAIRLQSPKQLLRNSAKYLKAFNEADTVFVTGGTPIYDYDHFSRFIHMGIPMLQRKPLILFGVGAKPVNTLTGKRIMKFLLRHASRISVRDVPSWDVLSKLTSKSVILTGDSALCMNHVERRRKKHEPTVLVCPRKLSMNNKPLYHEKLSVREIGVIRKAIATASDVLSETHRIVFVPFHTMELDDDRLEIMKIRHLMETSDVEVLDKPFSPENLFNLFNEADLLIGLRLHSLVLGALAGLPLVTINYDQKIRGFMEMLGLSDYICRLEDLNLNTLTYQAIKASDHHSEIRKALYFSIKKIKSRIMAEGITVNEYL